MTLGASAAADLGVDDVWAEAAEWVQVIHVARWLGVAPWELAAAPVTWIEWVMTVAQATEAAERIRRETKP